MKSAKTKGVILSLLILLSADVCFSAWSQPEFLSELNDNEQEQVATQPCISTDGLSIFFVRKDPSLVPHGSGSYFITEARRDAADGTFEDQRALTELGNRGSHIASPWISEDGLRLYYAEAISYQGRWQRLIKMAARESLSHQWMPQKVFHEIHGSYIDTEVSLTADEKLIMWRDYSLSEESKIFTASRSAMTSDFTNIKEVTELSDIGAISPFMSSDGLKVYFAMKSDLEPYELWTAQRTSLEEPFGDFTPLDDINQWGVAATTPCISPDSQSLYFFQRQGEPTDIHSKGIFVSYWFLTPYEQAQKNLDEAIAAKEQAHQLLSIAVEKETAAIEALSEIDAADLPEGVDPRSIKHGRIKVFRALQRQVNALADIEAALAYLKNAWGLINPFVSPEGPLEVQPD